MSLFLAVLATCGGCLMTALPSVAQTVPVLAAAYSGRWEAASTTGGTNSNKTSFAVTSQFQLDQKTGGYVATGTYTTYPSGYGYVACGTLVDIPMVIRWFPFESQVFNLVATPTDKSCPPRRFKLIREEPDGRMIWKSSDGQQSVYFDPDNR